MSERADTVTLKNLVRCPLADGNDCGQQSSYMVFEPGGIAPNGQPWNSYCPEFECPLQEAGPGGNRAPQTTDHA